MSLRDGREIKVVTYNFDTDEASAGTVHHGETDMAGMDVVAAVHGDLCAPRRMAPSCRWCRDLKARISSRTL